MGSEKSFVAVREYDTDARILEIDARVEVF